MFLYLRAVGLLRGYLLATVSNLRVLFLLPLISSNEKLLPHCHGQLLYKHSQLQQEFNCLLILIQGAINY